MNDIQCFDEIIAAEMLEHDFVVQMPPVREYTVRVRIKSIEKATPYIVGPEVIQWANVPIE